MIDGHHSGEVPPPAGSGAGHVVAAMRSAADALTGLCPGELPDAALSELLLDLDAEWNVLARWRAFFDTDGEEARAARQHEQRSWHVSPLLDGAWRGDANFTTEAGEVIRNAVDRRARALYRAEKAAADGNGEKVRSTAAQRRHDALLELILQATAAGDEGNGINVPAITAIIDITRLPDATSGEIVGETEAGTPVTAQTARRWCCDAGISRALTDTTSTPVDLGHTARLPSPAQRRALAARDRGCTFPGCDKQPGWTSIHHLTHWIHGGPTDLWNQTPQCPFHHHRLHEGGYGLQRLPNGQLEFTRPDGTPITVPKGKAPPAHGWNDAA
jgi:hypothetical protein